VGPSAGKQRVERVTAPAAVPRRETRRLLACVVALGVFLLAAEAYATSQRSGNPCVTASGSTNCTWDVRIDASANESLEGLVMHANWVATFKGFDLALQDRYIPTSGDFKDVIKTQGGRGGRGRIVGRISFERTGTCSWSKSFNVPALLNVNSYVKLRKPIKRGEGGRGLPFSFFVHTIPDVQGPNYSGFGIFGDECKEGDTEVVSEWGGAGNPQGPTPASGLVQWVDIEEGLSTGMWFEWWKPLPRLPYPLTLLRAGKSFTVAKRWNNPQHGNAGHYVVTFTRRTR
jgi:hypothetical protein